MKLKPAIKYHLSDTIKPVAIFYGIVILLFVVFATDNSVPGHKLLDERYRYGHHDLSVCGGTQFLQDALRLFVQTGFPAKPWSSVALASLALTAFMTAADSLLSCGKPGHSLYDPVSTVF